ncbi:related to ADH3-alcohol dehydrogenase III [Phialocephala subalpina]|uniref:Related to ADH3-alcohol dehydrogenase III n=1 Tax=Phialocephala subalpina TaxID=576137 RepID=A0A1L7XD93_9HELO|nr:related to ADH3-alcohol dehydrogenase III [Phialocephala subalpina]
MASNQPLPETHRALILTSRAYGPEIKTIPTPQPGPGNAIVRIEAANIISYSKHIYSGTRPYPLPVPLVIGTSAIGRIATTGPDAVSLKPGQLIFVDSFVRGRDDEDAAFLFGVHEGHSEESKILMRGEWRDATYAEYAKVPLENCYPLNEDLLVNKLGYGIAEDLQDLSRLLVPYGGLRDINLQPGETIIIAPATGAFGSAAVKCALAIGARVIALGRNLDALKPLASKSSNPARVETVQLTGDVQTDLKVLQVFGRIDAYLDISPPAAANSTHFKSCILSLRKGGRVSFMGGLNDEITIPIKAVVSRDLQLRGKWMYERKDVRDLIRMVEMGLLKLGGQKVDKFKLGEWEAAFDRAAEYAGSGGEKAAVIVP